MLFYYIILITQAPIVHLPFLLLIFVFFMYMLCYNSFCSLALGKKTTSVMVVDDCGNTWKCISIYGTRPYSHIKIGGILGRLVDARRLGVGIKIMIGVLNPGKK
jgi:hypothetical protein